MKPLLLLLGVRPCLKACNGHARCSYMIFRSRVLTVAIRNDMDERASSGRTPSQYLGTVLSNEVSITRNHATRRHAHPTVLRLLYASRSNASGMKSARGGSCFMVSCALTLIEPNKSEPWSLLLVYSLVAV